MQNIAVVATVVYHHLLLNWVLIFVIHMVLALIIIIIFLFSVALWDKFANTQLWQNEKCVNAETVCARTVKLCVSVRMNVYKRHKTATTKINK